MEMSYSPWRKSTHSGGGEGSHCIEVAALWRTASRSHAEGENCVEVAAVVDTVAIRDSKNPDGERLHLNRRHARSLAERIKNT